ncbi:MAG: hypothetical protein R3Y29_03095 [bacterium]
MYFKKPKIGEIEDNIENIENIIQEEDNKYGEDKEDKEEKEDKEDKEDKINQENDNGLDLEENLDYNPDDDFAQDSIRDMFDDKKGIFNMLLLFVFFIGIILFLYYRFYIN